MRPLPVICIALVAAGGLAAQSPWTSLRTPWGHPDLQGAWSGEDLTGVPQERPPALGTRNLLTDEEFAARLQRIQQPPRAENVEAVDVGFRLNPTTPSRQASLIVDPPDGRFPAITVSAERRRAEWERSRTGRGPADSFTDRSHGERCIVVNIPATAIPGTGIHIVQSPQEVAISTEIDHETRVISLDGRPYRGASVRTYAGDSRGWWEADTLVVETTNVLGRPVPPPLRGIFTSDRLKVIERFTRTASDTLSYQITVDDPDTWVRPWTISFDRRQYPNYRLFEFACHEGNYALRNILSGARADERNGR